MTNSASSRTPLIIVAWISTLLMSKFTILIAQESLSLDTKNINWLWISVGIFMFVLSFMWNTIRVLRGYFLIMTVVLSITTLLDPAMRESTVWENFISNSSPMIKLLGERVIIFIEALLVILVLLLITQSRYDFFLVKGQPESPAVGVNWLGKKKPASWKRFAAFMTIIIGILFTFFMTTLIHPSTNAFEQVLPLLPLVILAAMLNAFSEELMYRAAPLSQLWKAVGKTQALLLTAVFFGFGHYYGGIPSGPFGFLQTGLLALLLGKAMLETQGFLVPWLIHFILDTIIYIFLAIAGVTGG